MAIKLLYSDEKVAELLREYHETGNYRLRDAVVEHMRPLVHGVARKFAGREPLEDLESEGYVGGYLGIGLSAKLSRTVRIDLEARYARKDRLSNEELTTQVLPAVSDKSVQTVPLLADREEASELRAGLTFMF